MPSPDASQEFYRAMQRLQVVTVAAGRRAWSKMGTDFDPAWAKVAPSLLTVTAAAQLAAARTATEYVPVVLAETGQPDLPEARVRPQGFAGVASDGRSLSGLLAGAPRLAKAASADRIEVEQVDGGEIRTRVPGMAPAAALAYGGRWLDTALQTIVTDAARNAAQTETFVRPNMGWVRQINPPTCSRCAALAGKWYRSDDVLPRHANCFPAGVVVSGPGHAAATRRLYDGELVVFTTASGQQLPLTGNHPVLTSRGWVPANLLEEGDDVVRATAPEGARGLIVPDHHEVPSRIEDVWDALSVAGLRRVPSSPEDFHGDGQYGYVDVVGTNGALRNRRVGKSLGEQVVERDLTRRVRVAFSFDGESATELIDLGNAAQADSAVGFGGLRLPLLGGHLRRAQRASFASAAPLNASGDEAFGYRASADSVLTRERQFTGARLVCLDDFGQGEFPLQPRWDAPGDPFSMETRAGYARRGLDLRNRLSSQVELDRVIDLRRVQWSGHVYSLTSIEGWHSANGLIVSNCDCTLIPSQENRAGDFTTDPQMLVDSGLVTDLTKGQRERLTGGADLSTVLNESRDRWRERMAVERRANRDATKRSTWGTGSAQGPPRSPAEFMDFLKTDVNARVSRDDALTAMRSAGIVQ